MKRLAIFLACALLPGCAQWDTMTPQQKNLVIGVAAGSVVIGAAAAHRNDTVVRVPFDDEHR